jgi:hypothetical protein
MVPDFAATIPFSRGAEEILAWFDASAGRERPDRGRTVDDAVNRLMDTIIAAVESMLPGEQ